MKNYLTLQISKTCLQFTFIVGLRYVAYEEPCIAHKFIIMIRSDHLI